METTDLQNKNSLGLSQSKEVSSKIDEREETITRVDNTPFSIIKLENGSYTIMCGNYRASRKEFKFKQNAETHIRKIDWTMVTALALSIIQIEEEKNKEYTKKGPTGQHG